MSLQEAPQAGTSTRYRELPLKGAIDLNDNGTHTIWLDAKGRISTVMEDDRWSKYPEWYWKDWQTWDETVKQKKVKNAYNLMVRSKYHTIGKSERDRTRRNGGGGRFRSDSTTEKEDEEDRLLYEVDVLERALLVSQEQRHQAILDLQQIHEMEYAIFQRLNEARRTAGVSESNDQPIYPLIPTLPPAPNRTRRRSVSKSLSPVAADPTGLPQNITQEEMSAILADPANLELMHSLTEALASGGDVGAILAGINLDGSSGPPVEPAALGDADMEQLIAKAMAGIPFEVDEDVNGGSSAQVDPNETRVEAGDESQDPNGNAEGEKTTNSRENREPSVESETGDAWMAELLAQAGA